MTKTTVKPSNFNKEGDSNNDDSYCRSTFEAMGSNNDANTFDTRSPKSSLGNVMFYL